MYASPQTEALVTLALKVAAAEVPVLILGPNGAGKEKVAEIVQANSRRAKRPFVRVNAGALPETLIESELFGSEAGAFTGAKKREGRFEAADGGTIFLDEIGNLSLAGQMKLLRVLQTGEFERVGSSVTRKVDVRVVSATNADLPAMIAAGTFREDLYFRLNVIELRVPPLSERPDDVLPLARHFLEHFAPAGEAPPTLAEDARRALVAHAWPGNVRELRNCIQRAALLAAGGRITAADLHLRVERSAPPQAPVSAAATAPEDPEARAVRAALARADGVIATAAAELGISRQALYRRMDRLGIVVERRGDLAMSVRWPRVALAAAGAAAAGALLEGLVGSIPAVVGASLVGAGGQRGCCARPHRRRPTTPRPRCSSASSSWRPCWTPPRWPSSCATRTAPSCSPTAPRATCSTAAPTSPARTSTRCSPPAPRAPPRR